MAVGLKGLAHWPEIDGYLDHALDLAPAQREHWLARLTWSQPGIARLLRELLAEREALNASQFLEDSPLVDPPPTHARTKLEGTRIGAYTIERLLGRGGMGEVWFARRSDGRFEAECAIKFLDDAVSQEKLAERFRREGRLLARLTHPNIARLLDAGATADGKQFLVLEYVDGERIDRYCESHGLGIEARIRLFADAVLAVTHAHRNLIVHRDLKPSNVLVTRAGAVKLLDFGIAKLIGVQRPDGDESTRTLDEEIVLTPEYAAPEQLLGELPSTATDVYQLGMLLYVLLIGRHPLQSAGTRADRIRAALAGRVPRASDLATGALRKKLRGDLDAIMATALHPDPHRRYQTAAALRDELLRYLNRDPVTARRGARLYGMRTFIARHRVGVGASALGLVGLCATLAFALTQARIAAAERDRAFVLAMRNTAVTEYLGMLMTEAAEADKPITVNDMLARSEKLALADTSGNPESRAAVLRTIGMHYLAWGNRGKAATVLEHALAVLGEAPAHGLRSQVICNHALVISGMGRAPAAAATIDRALAQPPTDRATFAECLEARAVVARNLEDAEGSLLYATQALQELRLSGPISNEREAHVLQNLAASYHMTGRHREAFQHYEMALKKFTAGIPAAAEYLDRTSAVLGSAEAADKTPKVALMRGRLALALGQVAEARRRFEGVAATSSSKAPAVDGEIGKAEALLMAGDIAAAAESARTALDASISLQSGLPYSQRAGRAWLLLGRALQRLGKSAEADQALASAVTNLSNTIDESHPALIEARALSGQRLKP